MVAVMALVIFTTLTGTMIIVFLAMLTVLGYLFKLCTRVLCMALP